MVSFLRIVRQLPEGSLAGNTQKMAIQSRLPPFLLTRPKAQSDRFAVDLRKCFGADLRIISNPLIAPEFADVPLPDGNFEALIFTSETGVAAFASLRHQRGDMPTVAYCVGDRTARAATNIGLDTQSAGGDAGALIAMIAKTQPKGRLLHLHGVLTRGDVAGALNKSGIMTDSCAVYSQHPQPLGHEARALLEGEDRIVVPLFSPRTAAIFSSEVNALSVRCELICPVLSEAVANALTVKCDARIRCAAAPTSEALIEVIRVLFAADTAP
jgi:uroporphyrinogen-III synthase